MNLLPRLSNLKNKVKVHPFIVVAMILGLSLLGSTFLYVSFQNRAREDKINTQKIIESNEAKSRQECVIYAQNTAVAVAKNELLGVLERCGSYCKDMVNGKIRDQAFDPNEYDAYFKRCLQSRGLK